MTLIHRASVAALTSAVLLTGACGSDDSDPEVTREQASLMVQGTMVRAEADVDALQVQSNGSETTINATCVGGGSATATGSAAISPAPLEVNVNVALDYTGCTTSSDVTIDGSLDYSQQVIVGSEESLLYVETVLSGTAVLTGETEAVCDIDLNIVLDSSSGAIVSAEGSACGYAAGELNLSARKNW